ncbi:MAG: NAD(P)/FAD-dependent oxidoreductase [Bacteroidetes bacterium]|nr:NAD(P)/FAD-dependent oxidoreductase [Bacteroidota bacterium]
MENQSLYKGNIPRILIIGGGAAGFFAAIKAAETNPKAEILILEQGKEVLSKVRISGGGRCNVTHACFDPRELVQFYPRGKKALRGPFTRFCTGDTMEWYESRNVPLKIEDDGRVFPVSDKSSSIIDCLEGASANAGISVYKHKKVVQVYPPEEENQRWKVLTSKGESYFGDSLMIASGSSKSVWEMIRHLGHSIVPPVPSLFTFNIKLEWLHELAGVSVPHARVRVPKAKLETDGPLLITHWGLSGPAVLKASAWGARELFDLNYDFEARVNWLGSASRETVTEQLRAEKQVQAKKMINRKSPFPIPNRLWKAFCDLAGCQEDQRWADLRKDQLNKLAECLCDQPFPVRGKSTFKEEFVTAGGIDLDEVNFKRFESKIHRGLFFAGEVLDIDAVTGGFNFQAAWTGGWIAGEAMGDGNS